MSSLTWNEGMSVGIKAIDEDHKKILSIVSSILEAINENSSESIIEKSFDDLESSVSSHFKREEDLMREIDYVDFEQHKKGHQTFIAQIPEIKSQIFSSTSVESSEKISQLLYDWVINHILVSDVDYAKAALKLQSQAVKKSPSSLFMRFSNWLSCRIKLSARVFLIAVLPIVGMLMLSFIILKDNYQQYKNMELLSGLTKIVVQINSLTHSLQIERGLSSGYMSSNYQHFFKELIERRKSTDAKIQDFLAQLNHQVDLFDQAQLFSFAQKSKDDIARLNEYRSELEYSSVDQMFFAYTQLIGQLLSRVNNLVHIEMDSQLANSIIAISAVLKLKEIMGQERAQGTILIEKNMLDFQNSQDMKILLQRQLDALQVFNYSASEKQKSTCGAFCNEALHKESLSQLFVALMSSHGSSQTSPQWFMAMTKKIDNFKSISAQMIAELDLQTGLKLTSILHKYYFILAILSGIMLLNILLFITLNHSVITPIRRITHALTQMTLGHNTRQTDSHFANDEIGAMYSAYEMLRRKLTQADIAKNMISHQRRSLQHRKKESDRYKELASKDTLTGAINRREFNAILEQEIHFAQQSNQGLSIMALDIDHFKIINDTYGHSMGDMALISFYKTCCESVRASDVVARIGGEEFVILMPGMKLQQAEILAERVCNTVQELEIPINDQVITLTVSIGVAQWNANQFNNSDEFLACSDKALYEAKNRGRNCVVVKP